MTPPREQHFAAAAILLFLGVFAFFGKTQVEKYRRERSEQPLTLIARQLNELRTREHCDDLSARRREYSAAVVDKYRTELKGLWLERGEGGQPKFSLLDLGPIKLRISPKVSPVEGFDSSSWSWDEAYGLIQRTQQDPDSKDTKERWRDVDTMVKFLFEKDIAREVHGRKFLAPELTEHQFRPNRDITRTGPAEFTVALNPGDFRGHEPELARLLENEWRSESFHLRIRWDDKALYTLLAHSDSSRSFVNHRKRTMEIANLAWTKTVAHELGHVLGFDDHYYNVWNARNCYYLQESRLADIMSNSEKGGITKRHWEILTGVYPWKSAGPKEPFVYTYGK